MLDYRLPTTDYKIQSTKYRIRIFLIAVVCSLLAVVSVPAQAQGGFIPTPGQSCNRLADTKQREDCNKAICPQNKICAQGKCARMNEKNQPVDVELATLPCNYTIEDFVESGIRLVNFIFGIAGSLTLLFLVYGGYTMFTSFGNPEEIKKGRSIMTGAFIGLVLIVSAAFFIKFATSLVLPPGTSITPGLEVPVGSACTSDESCGTGMTCDQGVCKTQCEKDLGSQGYICMALGCLKDKDCGVGQKCVGVEANGGGFCAGAQEKVSPYLECKKNLCPGGATNQCCRVK